MRSGGYGVKQALNPESASTVKQAVALARRRGHAQVSPLHVATTLLSLSGGPLRSACMQSHSQSHPLQCKALELCFNVALNRLPPSPSTHQYPSISNALVAAFKRAQAHHRREPPQPKIELEQLIVSILDDPSVSRVMREAGFSSTQVKANVEKGGEKPDLQRCRFKTREKPDLQIIVEAMLTKKRSFVVVGESVSTIEGTVKELMNRVDKGGVPEGLREVRFITIPPLYSFCNLDKDLVEQKMQQLNNLVKSLVGTGVVLYLGDLNWISGYRVVNSFEQERRSCYCSVEHMIMEIGKLISEIGSEIGRFWVMGIATFQTYMRCRNGYYSLETIWRLNPLTIPTNSLGLSLISQSDNENGESREENGTSQQFHTNGDNLGNQATLSSLPPWLKVESRRRCNNNKNQVKCDSIEKTLTLSPSPSPLSSTLCFSFDQHNPNLQTWKDSQHSPPSCDVVSSFGRNYLKEFNAQNLNTLCNELEREVPWQREIIPEIAGTILQSRSRMLRRKDKTKDNNGVLEDHDDDVKEETWLLFLGNDSRAQKKISRYLARTVFGSCSNFISITMNGSDSSQDAYMERFVEAVSANPHRVFWFEGFEKADYCSKIRVKRAIESGRISSGSGEEVGLCDAIVVLSCERFKSTLMESSDRVLLDLNSSFDDDGSVEKKFVDDLGILEYVDRVVEFKVQN